MTRQEYNYKLTAFDKQKAIRRLKIENRYEHSESFTFMGTKNAKLKAYKQYSILRKQTRDREIELMSQELEIEIFGVEGKVGALKNLQSDYRNTKIILPYFWYGKN